MVKETRKDNKTPYLCEECGFASILNNIDEHIKHYNKRLKTCGVIK